MEDTEEVVVALTTILTQRIMKIKDFISQNPTKIRIRTTKEVRTLIKTRIKRISTKRQSMLSLYQDIEEAEAEVEEGTEAEEAISLNIEMMMIIRERQMMRKLNNLIKMEGIESRRLSTKTLVAEEATVEAVAEEATEDLRDKDSEMTTMLTFSRSENKSKESSNRLELVEEETSSLVTTDLANFRLMLIRNSEKVLQVLREAKCKIKAF